MINRVIFLNTLFLILIGSCKSDADVIPDNDQKISNHPFLIVKNKQFQALRDKAVVEPWKSMKADALKRSAEGSKSEAYDLQYYIGAAALACILDEDNVQVHANRVRDAILNQYSKLNLQEGAGWGGVVPPMGSFFVAILSLDIVYDELTPEEIEACEKVITEQISKIKREGSWADIRRGTHGTWDIYKGARTSPDDDYYNGIMAQITEDGVSPVTNHYAWERVGGGDSRISKSGYMDVLEFTGVDNRYYNNVKLQKFERWLFGSSVNCAKEMAIFGDMLPTQNLNNDMLHRRVVNFDSEAAGYAAWFHEGQPAKGNIITYIIPKSALPEPVVPSSKIYNNGGAFFREAGDNPNGLHAVLYNIKSQDEWHTHFEVNGLSLSGLGNRLLVNGGRLGEPVRAAYLNNTLTINGQNHAVRTGGGIDEGFTTDQLDYASGFSGQALENSSHYRNLLLVHGTEAASPYFVVFDEVRTAPGNVIKNYLHPGNQTEVGRIQSNEEYTAAIDHYPTVQGTKLTVYYATPPDEVNIGKVRSAVPDRYPGYPDHNRMEAVYSIDSEGSKNLATILFPHNSEVQKANFQRMEGDGFTGATLTQQENVTDYVISSKGDSAVQSVGTLVQAKAALWRKVNNQMVFVFVRKGTYFALDDFSVESDAPISFFLQGTKGVIVSPAAKVKITGSGAGNIGFDNAVEIINSGTNFIEVNLSEGTFSLN